MAQPRPERDRRPLPHLRRRHPLQVAASLGVIELLCLALYVAPRTSAFGALLLTAYLGGATATQVRVQAGWFPIIFPSLLGLMLWGALALRNPRVLELFVPSDV